jgi:hypothetical protein
MLRCALSNSVVKNLFWTRMNGYIDEAWRNDLKGDGYHLLKVLNGYVASIKRQKEKSLNDPVT